MRQIIQNERYKTRVFLILTFGISYLLAFIFFLSGIPFTSTYGIVLGVIYMFIPAFSTLIVEKVIHRSSIIRSLQISFKFNRWFIVAWLIPPILAALTFLISLLLPDVRYSPEMEGMFTRFSSLMTPDQIEEMRNSVEELPFHPVWITLAQGMIAGLTINALAGFGEELGWRGFLVRQFRNMHFLKAAILIGIIWGLWHAPIILMGHNYPQHPEFGVVMMTFWCILLSPVFLYILIKSRSVIAASIMHGTLNGTAGIAIMLIKGGNDLSVGATGLSGFIALMILIAFILIYDSLISKEKIMFNRLSFPENTSMAEPSDNIA